MNPRCTPDVARRLVQDGHRAALLLTAAAEQVIAAASALDPRDPQSEDEALERLETSLHLLQQSCELAERCVDELAHAMAELAPQPGFPSARGDTRIGRYSAL